MEESLASIRKIISEDSSEAPAGTAAEGEAPAPEAEQPEPAAVQGDAEILELTQEVKDEAPAEPEAQNAPMPARDDVVFAEIEETTMADADNSETVDRAEGEIFSDKTRAALDETFAGLADSAANAPPQPSLPPIEGHTVEAVFERAVQGSFENLLRDHLQTNADAIIDQMKPLIREWMDENFPTLLETAVRTEVARVVKARGRR
jgi:cell pole-organizing protein PopZ